MQSTDDKMTRLAISLTAAFIITQATLSNAWAKTGDFLQDREYQQCMQLARTKPENAFESALSWQDVGGGIRAKHCAATALFSLGHFPEAANRLQALAEEMPDDTPPGIVANILGQAGIAWQRADDLTQAYAVQSAALKLSPKNPDILTDRAITLMDSGKPWEAIDDLNAALEVAPDTPNILVFRGSAYRMQEAYDLALADLNRALKFDPDEPDGLLERGIVFRLTGQNDKARADWLKVIELYDGMPIAETARQNLEKLDVKVVK